MQVKYIGALFGLIACCANMMAQDHAAMVKEIYSLTGQEAGICAVLNCSDARFPLAIAASERFLVHGLTAEHTIAEQLRAGLGDSPYAGMCSIESIALQRLPYNARTVDLITSRTDLSVLIQAGLKAEELLRVLTPYGKACIPVQINKQTEIEAWLKAADISDYVFSKGSRDWLVITKPRDKGLDDWGHRGHAADGNPVSRDQVLEAPTLLQWIVGPTRDNGRGDNGDLARKPNGVVSADGRNYYVHGHNIAARNSFNGVLLWMKNFGSINMSQLVAAEKSLYLGVNGKLLELNGLNGAIVRTISENIKLSKILVSDQYLLAVGSNFVKVYNREDGQELWSRVRLGSICVQAGKIYGVPEPGMLTCLSLKDGSEVWKANTSSVLGGAGLHFVTGERLVCVEKQKKSTPVLVLDAASGEKVWQHVSDKGGASIYEAGGLLWIEHISPEKAKKGVKSLWVGFDINDGKEKLRHFGPENVKYRCHPVYATDRFMIANRPLYFMDWKSGEASTFEATRAQCGVAYCLAQGMFYGLYTTPNKCMCISTAIAGVTGFASDGTMNGELKTVKEGRLVSGTAKAPAVSAEKANDLWPMYRKDSRRTSSTAAAVSTELKTAWVQTLRPSNAESHMLSKDWKISRPSGDRISAPTVGGGKVFVSLPHEHLVKAVHIEDGKTAWTKHTPARVTAPPTYYQGLCIYGCHNGWVYCVRADNGEAVWSFRAAPDERRMMAYGQIESSWPIAGGVLLVDDLIYVVAGRLTEADGGLYIHALNPKTGKVIWSERRGRVDDKPFGAYQPRRMKTYVGTVDMLCSDGKIIGMAGSHRGRMDCKTGAFISHYNNAIPFGWNPTRFRTDQYGVRTVPVAYLKNSFVAIDRKSRSIRHHIKDGWRHTVDKQNRVEGLVAISDNAQEIKVSDWRPSTQAVQVATAPIIDGKIDAVFSKLGKPLDYVYLNGRSNKQQEATTAWVLCDKENLYMAFRCKKKNPNNIVCNKIKRDDAIWRDEVVEIFLDPTNSRSNKYYHIIANSAAVIQDSFKGDKKWNGEIEVKAGKEADAWTLEVRIPFKTLNVNVSEGAPVWTVNFNRSARKVNGSKVNEDTAWAPTNTDSSHVPDMFGYLWIASMAGGDDQVAYKTWQEGLPAKPKTENESQGSFQNLLLAAVAKDKSDPSKGGELRMLSLEDGKLIKSYELPVAPAHDGIAVAEGKIFISLRDTTVICLSGK